MRRRTQHPITPSQHASPSHPRFTSPAACLIGCVCLLLTLSACTRTLVTTPTLYSRYESQPFATTPEPFKTTDVDLMFVTDRKPAIYNEDKLRFGAQRAHDMIYGSIKIKIGNTHDQWDDLLRDSTRAHRRSSYPVTTTHVQMDGMLHDLVSGFIAIDDHHVVLSPESQERKQREDAVFTEHLKARLAPCNRKEIYLFVHGVNTNLPYSAQTLAQTWHFLGRDGVPIVYSWPAAEGGLRAYAYSRESSEFTVSHLKRVIRLIAACDDVERIHIIAHSRGCDIVLAALREIEIQRESEHTQVPSKLDTVVLAAADIDQGVFRERVFGERVFETPRRIVLYTSANDGAMDIADWMLDSVGRIGEFVLSAMDAPPEIRERLSAFQSVQIIECLGSSGGSGHDYFYTNPAVLSDLILVLRDRLDPGAENGRPLSRSPDGTWQITRSYPSLSPALPAKDDTQSPGPHASPSRASSGSASPDP